MALALTLVVDSNILFAAAIRDGDNAKLLLSDRLRLIAPEWLFEEFRKYKPLLLEKTHRSSEEFGRFLAILEEKIEVIPENEFKPWIEHAKANSPENDFSFTALAKAYECPVWSNDRGLKESMEKTRFARVLNTKEVLDKLELASGPK